MKTEQEYKIERLEKEVKFLNSIIQDMYNELTNHHRVDLDIKPKDNYVMIRNIGGSYRVENNSILECEGSEKSCRDYIYRQLYK